MEAGGLEEARARRIRKPCAHFVLDLVHDDYSPYYSLRCIPSDTCMQNPEDPGRGTCDVHTHTFCERDRASSRSEEEVQRHAIAEVLEESYVGAVGAAACCC